MNVNKLAALKKFEESRKNKITVNVINKDVFIVPGEESQFDGRYGTFGEYF